MPDPEALRSRSAELTDQARRCRTVAADIESRRHLLPARLDQVRLRHTPDVWQSRAATRSRDLVNLGIAPGLWFVSEELGGTVRRLVERADELEQQARSLLDTAGEQARSLLDTAGEQARSLLDTAGEQAGTELRSPVAVPGFSMAPDSIEPDARDAAIGAAVPPILPRPY